MTEEHNLNIKYKKYKLVPPDGGWGYMIWIATIINLSTTTSFAACFGMIFNDFMIDIEMGSTEFTLLNGMNAMCISFAGFLTGPLLKIMNMRLLACVASIFFNLGIFCTIFVNSKAPFFICQSLLQCVGCGILYNLSCTALNDYFVVKRLLSVSFTQTITAVAGMIAPMFCKWSLDYYGFRGTLILLSAISLHSFVGCALMQPVAWHMRKVEIPESSAEELKLLSTDKNLVVTPTITLTDTESPFEKNVLTPGRQKDSVIMRLLKDMMDFKNLKSYMLTNVSLGTSFTAFVEFTCMLMLPQALYSFGWDKKTTALSLSLIGFVDLSMRILLIILNKWLLEKISCIHIFLAGLVMAVISRLGMLWSKNLTVALIFAAMMGVPRCTISVIPPLAIAETYPAEQFSSAMGAFMLNYGLICLVFGPVIGIIRDLTNSYQTVFYILTSLVASVLILWVIEIVYMKNKHKWQERENTNKSRSRNNKRKK